MINKYQGLSDIRFFKLCAFPLFHALSCNSQTAQRSLAKSWQNKFGGGYGNQAFRAEIQ
jgi:hypothetical protein